MKGIPCCLGLLLAFSTGFAQTPTDTIYTAAFTEIEAMLDGTNARSLQRAVFLVENAYLGGQLSYDDFDAVIDDYATLARAWAKQIPLAQYGKKDSLDFALKYAAYHVLTDTTFLFPGLPASLPFAYDTLDYFGSMHWENTFVTKLLVSGVGNCHSLPLLYKLICDRLGTEAFLAVAPDHMYVKQRSKKHGWYNVELTSATFPDDAWIMATGYISLDAIRSGTYMVTLGTTGSLALCLTDLAQGYERRYPEHNESFMLQCCEVALRHNPASVVALLLQISALARLSAATSDERLKAQLRESLEIASDQLARLDYREVPMEVYLQWIAELSSSRGRFQQPVELKP